MPRSAAPASPAPYPGSLCHRCAACRAVVTGRGSLFLRCTARAQKYLPQPVRRCPVFEPAEHVIARGPGGDVLIRWWAAPLAGALIVRADGRGGLVGELPEGRAGVSPGLGLAAASHGALWRPDAGRGRWLGWVTHGADQLLSWPADAEVELIPARIGRRGG